MEQLQEARIASSGCDVVMWEVVEEVIVCGMRRVDFGRKARDCFENF